MATENDTPRDRRLTEAAHVERPDAPALVMAEPRDALRKVEQGPSDFYTGTLNEIVALGFVALEMFPGQPGRPTTSVSIRPEGVVKPKTHWWCEPGYINISRSASQRYQMRIAVSEIEQRRRERARAKVAAQEERDDDVVVAGSADEVEQLAKVMNDNKLSVADVLKAVADVLNAVDVSMRRPAKGTRQLPCGHLRLVGADGAD